MKFEFGSDSEDSKNYVKLKDGESVRGVFRGEALAFKKHWVVNHTELCTGEGCKHCAADPKTRPAFRFRLNFIVKEQGGYATKIVEQGWKFYKQLKSINDEVPLETVLVKITRTGSTKNDTTYTVIPVPNGSITAEKESELKQVALLDLRVVPQGSADGPPMEEQHPAFTEEDIPF